MFVLRSYLPRGKLAGTNGTGHGADQYLNETNFGSIVCRFRRHMSPSESGAVDLPRWLMLFSQT